MSYFLGNFFETGIYLHISVRYAKTNLLLNQSNKFLLIIIFTLSNILLNSDGNLILLLNLEVN